jgi:MFS family permease
MIIHALASVPLGILADRWTRRKIISFGVLVWSLATFFSGIVQNFYQLLGARSIVGIGEAAYGPSATSLLADKYPDERRAWVNSIFHLGMFAGGTLGMVLAGIIGTNLGWRACFFIVGIPGFILAIISWNIREDREHHEHVADIERNYMRMIFKSVPYITMLAGGVLLAFTSGAIISWITEFIVRYHHFTVQQASVWIGSIVLIAGLSGIYAGGRLADRLHKKGIPRSMVIGIGFLIATPLLLIIATTTTPSVLLVSLFLGTFFMAWYYGPVVALIQDIVPVNVRGTAYAFYIFFIHLLGDTISPSAMGKLSDLYSLKTAFYLPIATNFLGGMFFFLTTYLIMKQTKAKSLIVESKT